MKTSDPRTVRFHFDFGSPNAYLSHLLVPEIEARHDVTFDYVPVLLGGVFRETGNRSPAEVFAAVPNKLAYMRRETERFIARYGLAERYRRNPKFPIVTLTLMRGALAAQDLGVFRAYVDTVYTGFWQMGLDMGDPGIVADCLRTAGLDAEGIFARATEQPVKDRLIANTKEAVGMGDFGSPTFHFAGEMYFGKDSLRDLEEHLAAKADQTGGAAQ